jgi:hypothetical protein
MRLNYTERIVLETMKMRLGERHALDFLQANGSKISRSHYYRVKATLEESKLKRLHEIGLYGFVDQHLERIDNLELIVKQMWENYWKEKSPYRAVCILEKIVHVQPYLSAYYEATKYVMEKSNSPETNIDPSCLER